MCAWTDPRRRAAVLVTIGVQQERAEWGGAGKAREAEEVGMKEGRAACLSSSWEGERERSGEAKTKTGWFQWLLQSFLQFSSASFLPMTGSFSLPHAKGQQFSEDSGNLLAAS